MSAEQSDCGPHRFPSSHNRCCDGCPEGQYVYTECDENNQTKCLPCHHGQYMETSNFLKGCRPCKSCNAHAFQETESVCQADRDTQCKCKKGFYCEDRDCEHCRPAKKCPVGEGVKTNHTSKSDTVCVSCSSGEYSNVTDLYAPCLKHTDCESLGQRLETRGTDISDAKCSSGCPWMVPTCLWVGFVTTVLLVFIVYVYRRRARRRCAEITGSESTEKPGHLSLILHEKDLHFPTLCFDDKFNNHPPPSAVQMDDYTGPSEIECDGVNMTVLPSAESFSKPPVSEDVRGNLIPASLCHSEPQEDEWAET